MPIATHLIKIKGEFDENWNEEKVKELVKSKFKDIDEYFHADLELLYVHENIIDIWVYIKALLADFQIEDITKEWINHHIKEEGIVLKNLEIEKLSRDFGVILNDVALESL